MAKMTYAEQLRHPNWQKKRLEALQNAEWKCERCHDKETTLNVHHRRYVKGRMAWEYELKELAVLCQPCHEDEHADQEILTRMIHEADFGYPGMRVAIGLLAGYLDATCSIDPDLAESARQISELYYELGVAAACLHHDDTWRKVVCEYVASKRPSTPTMQIWAEQWAAAKD